MLEGVFDRIIANPYLIGVHVLALTGSVVFASFSKIPKKQPRFYMALFLLWMVSFYELFGSITLVNRDFNESMHHLISNLPYQGWNLWAYNIFNFQISKVILVAWIYLFIQNPKLKRVLLFLLIGFVAITLFLDFSKIEEITLHQPIVYFMSYMLSIVASCLFFVDLISSDDYLDINPLRFIPFWFITFNLFQNVILILAEIERDYLTFNELPLYYFFKDISMILYLLMLTSIVLIFINRGLLIEKKAQTI